MTDTEGRRRALTDIRTVFRASLWNIGGRIGPLLIAIVATPILIHQLGVPRWGLFTLALSLVGIFGIFDFGIGRALTRTVAEHLSDGRDEQAATLAFTGTVLVTFLSIGSTLIASFFIPYLVRDVLVMPPDLCREALLAMYVVACATPFVILNAALWGIISAYQRFAAANLINVVVLPFYYVGPILALLITDSLVAVMFVLLACRLTMTAGYTVLCLRLMPALHRARFDFAAFRPLLAMSGWMTVSNLLFAATLYLDRFVVSAMLSVTAVAYYATPVDLVNRFWVVPVAIMTSAFPAMATGYVSDPGRTASLFRRGLIMISVVVFPAAACAVGLPDIILTAWLGGDFAAQAAPVLGCLGIGIFYSCLAFVPTGFLDSIGRADINARLMLAQTVIYLPALFALVSVAGIGGAALAWIARTLTAFGLALWFAGRRSRPLAGEIRRMVPAIVTAMILLVPLRLVDGLTVRIVMLAASVPIYYTVVWSTSLTADDQSAARRVFWRGAGFLRQLRLQAM